MQRVVATLSNGINASTLQCKFITGSDATGCMVVLTSEYSQKTQYNLTRNSTISEVLSVTLEHSLSCYTEVKAFDIESDGSVGTLPVPGQLIVNSQAPCTPPLSGDNCMFCFMIIMDLSRGWGALAYPIHVFLNYFISTQITLSYWNWFDFFSSCTWIISL